MKKLNDTEIEGIFKLLKSGEKLDKKWLEYLFHVPPGGEFLWQEKYESSKEDSELLWQKKHENNDENPELPNTEDLEKKILRLDYIGWKNLLFKGDNLLSLKLLGEKTLSHKIAEQGGLKLIYIDPPFAVGTDFHATPDKKKNVKTEEIEKNKKEYSEKYKEKYKEEKVLAYSDRWDSMSDYYNMLYPRLKLMHKLLHEKGLLCLHCDWRASPGLRFMLNEIFGEEAFVNEIIWNYTGGGRSKRYFSRKHDCILVYSKGQSWTFNIDAMRQPYKKTSGFAKSGIVSKAGKLYKPNPKGTPADDVWRIPMLNPMAHERVAYATQKPLALLDRIIEAFSDEGDIVADFFFGTGTSLVSAVQLGRKFIGCDLGDLALKTCLKRMEDIELNAERCLKTKTLDLYLF